MVSKRLRFPALFLAAALTFLGAGGAGGSGTGSAGIPVLPKVDGLEKTTLNAAISPVVDSGGFFVALREGLFAQEGLTVNYSPASGDQVIRGQVNGQYDITATNYVSYIEAQVSHRADLRIVAEASLLQPGSRVIMTTPKSRIVSLDDLRGHVLGVNADPNVGFLLAASVLTESGIPMSRNAAAGTVTFPAFSMPFPNAAPALESGKVAAAYVALKPGQGHIDEQTAALMALNIYPLSIDAARLQRVADMMQQFGFLSGHFSVRQLLS